MKIIMVISHERSGTHFLIDSIVKNFKSAVFPIIRPSFSTVENLLLPHDKKVTETFYNFLFNTGQSDEIRLFKTHLLPLEFEFALDNDDYLINEKDRLIIDYLYNHATKIYISRDVRDVMVSLFHYMRLGGGLQDAMDQRLAEISISEFIRMPNYHIMPCRSFMEFDRNLITYWAYHVSQWQNAEVVQVTFENLKKNYIQTMRRIAHELKINHLLVDQIAPPNLPNDATESDNTLLYKLARDVLPGRLARKVLPRISKSEKQESTAVLPRKGIIGNHKIYFNSEDYDFIQENVKTYIPDVGHNQA